MTTPESQSSQGAQPPLPLNPLEQAQRDRSVLLRFLRIGFFVMMVTVALLLVLQQQSESSSQGFPASAPPTRRLPLPTTTPTHTSAVGESGTGAGSVEPEPSGAAGAPAGGEGNPAAGGASPSAPEEESGAGARPWPGVASRALRNSTGSGYTTPSVDNSLTINFWPTLVATVAFFVLVLLIDWVTPNKKIAAISGVFLGTVTGILATVALSFVIDLVVRTWIPDEAVFNAMRPLMTTIKVMMGISLCYLGISTVLQTQDQFRLVIPYVEFSKQLRGVRPNLLDTSALIDARIVDVAATGIVQSAFIVPRFVIAELQLLADSSDKLKRARGRRGLDVVTRLQRMGSVEVIIDETPVTAIGVDQMLIELAEKLGGRVVTTDLGLARVAQIKGLTAINLHDLANSLRPALVPGEQIHIRVVKGGEQAGQGVGYLDDGTMVVVEGGAPYIGQEIPLLVTSTMQTTAGRLVFARPLEALGAEEAVASEGDAGATSPGGVPVGPGAHGGGAASEAVPASAATPAVAAIQPQRPAANGPGPGPGIPKGGRRSVSPRNPRRWPPASE
jgi:uncharacterized protein YacL